MALIFSDGFENGIAGVWAKGWDTPWPAGRSNIYIESDVFHSGGHCVAIYANSLWKSLSPALTEGYISLYFYELLEGSMGPPGGFGLEFVGSGYINWHFIVGAILNRSGDYYSCMSEEEQPPGYGYWHVTPVPRSLGWHHLEVWISGGLLKASLDGTVILEGFHQDSISQLQFNCYPGLTTYIYIDDVEIHSGGVEPPPINIPPIHLPPPLPPPIRIPPIHIPTDYASGIYSSVGQIINLY